MLSVYCDERNSRVLLDLQSVMGLDGDGGRLALTYQCICGQRGRLLTGRDRVGGGMSGHITA